MGEIESDVPDGEHEEHREGDDDDESQQRPFTRLLDLLPQAEHAAMVTRCSVALVAASAGTVREVNDARDR